MSIASDLVSQLVKATKDNVLKLSDIPLYGTVVEYGGETYVKLDGSDLLTPVSKTADIKNGERVTVAINNHTATVTGNLTAPSARHEDVEYIGSKITEFEVILADKVDVKELYAESARIDALVTESLTVKDWITAKGADIETLKTDNIEILGKLDAYDADILLLRTDKLSATEADLKYATIDNLKATNLTVEELQTKKLSVSDADLKYATIESLDASTADINKLKTEKLDASEADLKYATIDILEAAEAEINKLKTDKLSATEADLRYATIDILEAAEAEIDTLKTNKLDASEAEVTYANIDFSNIGKAAMEYFYANSGLIDNVVIGDGTITGNLVGVTIKGDLIEGGTVKADKLVIKGTDGLYYKLNTDGVKTEAEQTDYNSINGSVITAQSITATKIDVDDLVAFDATIGGFNITENSIYSGVKESVNNTTRGIYLDDDGQIAFGDSDYFLKFYKTESGAYKLAISADSILFGSSKKSVETAIGDAAKSATDYMKFVPGMGLIISDDATVETLGKNLLLESDGVNIRNNDTVLARFEDDAIYLGKNNSYSVIDLCDGSAQMRSRDLSLDNKEWIEFQITSQHALNLGANGNVQLYADSTYSHSTYGYRMINGYLSIAPDDLYNDDPEHYQPYVKLGIEEWRDSDKSMYIGQVSLNPSEVALEATSWFTDVMSDAIIRLHGYKEGLNYSSSTNGSQIELIANEIYCDGRMTLSQALAIANGGTGGTSVNTARNNLKTWGYAFVGTDTTYPGLVRPNGTDTGYVRTPQSGLLPYQTGGHGTVGTKTWPFNNGYFNNLYIGGENVLGEDWITATLTSSFGNYNDLASNAPKYRKIGKIVYVRGVVKPKVNITSDTTQHTIFTLPSGYRPSINVSVVCQGSGANKWLCIASSSGAVTFSRYGPGNAYANVAADSAWLPFNFSFTID